jgi:uncharacterized damage-inducible protein DinB
MDVPLIQELYQYNRWANDRVFEAVAALSPKDFTKDLDNSHPSVRDTLTHIISGEWIWLQRWKGVSPRQIRGQLTTMLRQLKAVPVATDFLVFHDELESPSV